MPSKLLKQLFLGLGCDYIYTHGASWSKWIWKGSSAASRIISQNVLLILILLEVQWNQTSTCTNDFHITDLEERNDCVFKRHIITNFLGSFQIWMTLFWVTKNMDRSIEGKCEMKMDHHCPKVGICFGLRNHKAFWLLLLYLYRCKL